MISLDEAVAFTTCSQARRTKMSFSEKNTKQKAEQIFFLVKMKNAQDSTVLSFLGEKVSLGSSRRCCQLGERGWLGKLWRSQPGHIKVQEIAFSPSSPLTSSSPSSKKSLLPCHSGRRTSAHPPVQKEEKR